LVIQTATTKTTTMYSKQAGRQQQNDFLFVMFENIFFSPSRGLCLHTPKETKQREGGMLSLNGIRQTTAIHYNVPCMQLIPS